MAHSDFDDDFEREDDLEELIADLDDMYGCDPWDDDNFGFHTASRPIHNTTGAHAPSREQGESVDSYIERVGREGYMQ